MPIKLGARTVYILFVKTEYGRPEAPHLLLVLLLHICICPRAQLSVLVVFFLFPQISALPYTHFITLRQFLIKIKVKASGSEVSRHSIRGIATARAAPGDSGGEKPICSYFQRREHLTGRSDYVRRHAGVSNRKHSKQFLHNPSNVIHLHQQSS